jgi:lipopolysaccharide transport system ATP-binding protein
MSQSDIAISVNGLSKAYTISHNAPRRATFGETLMNRLRSPFRRVERETFWALKDVDFEIKKGEVVGIIGRNGAGKSTLLKILSRITEPTSGRIELFGRVGSLLEVGTGFHQELTGRENIFLNGAILGMTRAEIKKEFDAIVAFADVERFLDTPVKRYSSGMYVRLAFAVAAHLNPQILIVDEVLAVGDSDFQRKCLGKMKEVALGGRTVLFVSHNMGSISTLCHKGILLSSGQVMKLGSVEDAVANYLRAGIGTEFHPETGPLKRVHAVQRGRSLLVEADFEHNEMLRLPNLGVVISDMMGTPICGANPQIFGIDRSPQPMRAGRITLEFTGPALMDGQYWMSFWFGDGHHDFVSYPNCITIDIRGMATIRQLPTNVVGTVVPQCTFMFDAPHLGER